MGVWKVTRNFRSSEGTLTEGEIRKDLSDDQVQQFNNSSPGVLIEHVEEDAPAKKKQPAKRQQKPAQNRQQKAG